MAEYTRILLRQGPELERNAVVLKSGEPAWVTDYQRIVVGDGNKLGGVSIGSKFLGFARFDDISTLVEDVQPGYPGDFIFETTSNLLYVLSGSETILGKRAYEIKTNYVPINKTPSPDEITITGGAGVLSIAEEGIDARYIAPYAFGRGLERDPNNNAIIRMKDPSPELSFRSNILQLTDGGVKFSKLEPMFANEILGSLDTGGSPRPYPLDIIAAALRPYLTGEIDGITLGVPVGTIIDFAGPETSVPSNYLPCDGRELDIKEYIELHTVLKGAWGASLSSFNLPNLNKRTTIGSGDDTIGSQLSSIGNTVGSYGGSESIRLSQKNLPKHIHGVNFTLPAHSHPLTINLPKFFGSYETGDIITNGFNHYITVIGGSGPQSAPRTTPAGPVDELSNLRAQAAQNILNNKEYIQSRVVDYVYTNFPWALTATYTNSQLQAGVTPLSAICFRDTGYIVDSIAADLTNNANHRSVETGILYFSGYITKELNDSLTIKGPTDVFALPQDQVMPTVLAISAIAGFITGIGLPSYQPNYTSTSVLTSSIYYTDLQKVIIDGLSNFTRVISLSTDIPVTTPGGTPPDITYNLAAEDILKNKHQIQQRVVDYVMYNFPYALSGASDVSGLVLSAKCFRDTGYILDSIAADLKNNSNHRSVETGVFYFSGAVLNRASNGETTVPTLPQDQVFATIQAISSIEGFTTGILMPFERGYTTNGILSADAYYNLSQQKMLSSLSNFTTVIQDQTTVPMTSPAGFIPSGEELLYSNTGTLIASFREELQQQIVEYVKFAFPYALSGMDSMESDALSAKCFRDTGFIVDALVADIYNNTNHRSIEAGQFYFNGAVLARQYNENSSVPTLPEDQVIATINAISAIGRYIVDPSNLSYPPVHTPIAGILPQTTALMALSSKVYELIDTMIYPLENNGESLSYMPAGSSTNSDQYYGYMLIDNKSTIQKAVSSYVYAKKYLRKINNPTQSYMISGLNNFTRVISNVNDVPRTNVPGNTSDPSYQIASNLIKPYRSILQQQTVEYVKYYFPDALSGLNSFESDALSAKCFRDTGYIIDSIVADIASNTNHRSVETGVFYFSGAVLARESNPGSSVPTLPTNQVDATISAISAIGKFITGQGEVQPGVSIYEILSAGSGGQSRKETVWNLIQAMVYPLQTSGMKLEYSPNTTPSSDSIMLGELLESRRTDIQRSVSAYVLERNYLTFSQSASAELTAKCNRDVGYMVDAIVNDLKTGINAKSIQYAVAYWDGSSTRLPESFIPNQIDNTLDTIEFLKQTVLDVANEELTNKCNRDVGYMVDAVSHDLITGVNARSIQYAVAYWDGNTSRIPDSNIPDQRANTLDTITYLRSAMLDIAVKVSNNVTNTSFKKIRELVKTMIYPLQNDGMTLPYNPIGVPVDGYQEIVDILKRNKENIQDGVSNYVSRRGYLLVGSDLLAKCRRDVGFMVDALINDLETGVNAKSVQYALAYWDGSTSRLPESLVPNQRINTIDSINFLRSIVLDLMPKEEGIANQISNLVSTVYYPLLNRGAKLPYNPAGVVITQERAFAANLLERSRKEIQDRTIEHVRTLNIITDRADLQNKCYRDIGYMVDSVVTDLRTGVDAQSIQFALAYWTGNLNRLGGAAVGINNNVDQRAATISTIRFLRDFCLDRVIEQGGGTTQTAPITSTTGPNEKFEFYGYTDDGNFASDPFSALQPSAVVNKIIKVK